MKWIRVLLAVACCVLVISSRVTAAQDATQSAEPAVQTVAHGLMAMPSETMAWQSEMQRAVVSPRAEAVAQPGGFVLADTGAVAVTDADGRLLQRLAPGQASWIDPGDMRAIVSLESRSAGYLRVSLIPAAFIPDEPGATSSGEPFSVPPGVLGLDLLRDILERGEEVVVSSGEAPAFLQVTSGKVYVTWESGEIQEVASGSPLQFQGQITVSGGSRTPAAFVIARLGPRVPARAVLLGPLATPAATPVASPQATPLATVEGASISVEALLCPPGYDEAAPLLSCTGPAAGVRFTADAGDKTVNALADVAGTVVFSELPPGPVTLRANLPDGASTAVASCRDLRGDAPGRIRDEVLSLKLPPGSDVTCSWFITPGETWPQATLSVSVLDCPAAMTAEALHPEFCVPAETHVGLELQLQGLVLEPAQSGDDVWVWGPLLEPTYDLAISDLPSGVRSAVLDDGTVVEEGEPLEVVLDDEPAPVRTLYLLRSPDAASADLDSDADRLSDGEESAIGTDPFFPDSDDDGLLDGDEVGFYGTDPLASDTDDDGLGDQEEVAVYFTNPFLADTDGDGVSDAEEIAGLTNPLDMLSVPPTPTPEPTATALPTPTEEPVATPGASPVTPESTPVSTPGATPEVSATRAPAALPTLSPGASPVSFQIPATATPTSTPTDAAFALDNDGLTTLEEVAIHGTDPVTADTDGDGVNDGDEVASGRDPLDPAK